MNRISGERMILDRLAQTSVELNGLMIPGRLIESTIARHTFNMAVLNDHDIFKVSLVGSATAIRYRGRELLLTTQHQLKGVELERVAMLTDTGSHVITSGGVRSYPLSAETDGYDIAAFDFTEPCEHIPELGRRFFNLDSRPLDCINTDILMLLLFGYPSKKQVYELEEKNHLGIARAHVVCTPESQPSDRAMLTVRAVSSLPFDPDGMSGGSAFVIQMDCGKPRAHFAGIVLRGGRQLFHILKVGTVRAFLDSAFG
ncbi:hypothetical protein ACLBXM_17045 [Xanthobacteraceae bacterium A53D]